MTGAIVLWPGTIKLPQVYRLRAIDVVTAISECSTDLETLNAGT